MYTITQKMDVNMNKTVYGYVIWDTKHQCRYLHTYTTKGGAQVGFNANRQCGWDENGNRVMEPAFKDQTRYVIRPLVLGDE